MNKDCISIMYYYRCRPTDQGKKIVSLPFKNSTIMGKKIAQLTPELKEFILAQNMHKNKTLTIVNVVRVFCVFDVNL
jgi:hypothetical protein